MGYITIIEPTIDPIGKSRKLIKQRLFLDILFLRISDSNIDLGQRINDQMIKTLHLKLRITYICVNYYTSGGFDPGSLSRGNISRFNVKVDVKYKL